MKAFWQSIPSGLLFVVLALLTIFMLFWANLQFVELNPGGNDFLPRWLGARLFITEGQDPYSTETTEAIQQFMYGRQAWESEDQALFAYPFYTIFVIAPLALIENFSLARAIWLTVLEFSLFAIAFLSMRLANWKAEKKGLIAFFLFSLLWYHSTKPLLEGNMSILVSLFLVLGLHFLSKKKDGSASFFFALTMIKPQMVILLVPLALIWAFSNKRFTFIYGFITSFTLLIIASFALQANWLIANLAQIITYPSYVPPGTPSMIFADWWPQGGAEWGWLISIMLFGLLLLEWWRAMAKPLSHFLWVAYLTMIVTHFIGIPSTTSNFAMMLAIFPLIFAFWNRRIDNNNSRLEIYAMLILTLGLWILYTSTLLPGYQYREHLIMFFPAPILLLLNLYWLRWWMITPPAQSYPGKLLRNEVNG